MSTRVSRRGGSMFPAISARAPSAREVKLWDGPRPPTAPKADPGDFVLPDPSTPRRSSTFKGNTNLQSWPANTRSESRVPTKPRFLATLEDWLDKSLADAAGMDQPEAALGEGAVSDAAMEVYDHVFDRLLSEFTTYGPMLARIKAAYDGQLAASKRKIAEMQPAVDRVQNIETEILVAVSAAQAEKDVKIKRLQVERKGLREQLEGFDRLRNLYESTLIDSRRAIKDKDDTQLEMLAQHEQSKVLVQSIQRLQHTLQQRDSLVDGDHQKSFSLQEQLWKASDKHRELLEKYDKMLEQLEQRSAQLDSTRKNLEQMTSRYERSQIELKQATSDYHRTRNQYRTVRKRLREGSATGVGGKPIDPDTGRALTPRPIWTDVRSSMPDTLPFDTAEIADPKTSSSDAVNLLVTWLTKAGKDLKEAEAALPWKTDNEERVAEMKRQATAMAAGQEGFTGKWFVCQGTGHGVPRYLRFNGKVKNKMLSKKETENFLKQFWEAKIKADTRPNATPKSVPDFFFDMCKSRFGVQNMIAQWGYNFVDALQRYSHDADCAIFLQILNGNMCEQAYYDQMEMLEKFSEHCEKRDKFEHGGTIRGHIAREQFVQCVVDFFPHKTDSDIQLLKRALTYDQPLAEIGYVRLMEEDDEGNQGKFAEAVRDQHLYTIISCYHRIEQAVRERVRIVEGGEDARLAKLTRGQSKKDAARALQHQENLNKSQGLNSTMSSVQWANMSDDGEEEINETTVLVIKEALLQQDPGYPKEELERILWVGVNGEVLSPDQQAKMEAISEYRKVDINQFYENIHKIVIRRYSKPPQEEEDANTARGLSEEEQAAIQAAFKRLDVTDSGKLNPDLVKSLLREVYIFEPTDSMVAALELLEQENYRQDSEERDIREAERAVGDDKHIGSLHRVEHGIDFNTLVIGLVTLPQLRVCGDLYIWRSTFCKFDGDGSGTIDSVELEEMISALLGDEVDEEQTNILLEAMGITEEVSWTAFGRLMVSLGASSDPTAQMGQEKDDLATTGEIALEKDESTESLFPVHARELLDQLAKDSHVGELTDASVVASASFDDSPF